MAAIITLSDRAGGANTHTVFERSLLSFATNVRSFFNPTPAATRSVPLERPLVANRNPARHGVTPMAPQDFPLCAAFQEE